MQVSQLPIHAVDWPIRLRSLDQRHVDTLKSSMAEIGLISPITVFMTADGDYVLAAGAHRLKAAQALGWTMIDAVIMDGADVDRELTEIDENLCRLELGPAQRAWHLSRRKELWMARQAAGLAPESADAAQFANTEHPELGGAICATQLQGDGVTSLGAVANADSRGQRKSPQQHPGFATSTAMLTGDSKGAINRDVRRGEALGNDLQEIAGTSLDKGVELDALTKLDPEERKDLTRRAKAGEAVSARKTLAGKTRASADGRHGIAERVIVALEKCADVMDEREFEIVLRNREVSGVIGRLAAVIVARCAETTGRSRKYPDAVTGDS